MAPPPVPVLMFHSVAPTPCGNPMPWLVYPVDLFELAVHDLSRRGYTTPTLDQLHDHLRGRARLPERSVVLTFDDGYLDNWVFVEPILRRYGLRGVVWVTRDFIESGETSRPAIDVDDPSNRFEGITWWGFLNRAELRSLNARGVLEIQSHASTHTWWFSGPRIVDYHRPGSPHFWMAWNADPTQKTLWLTENQDHLVSWGTPVYEHARSMVRRYLPDPQLDQRVVDHVAENGGVEFFARDDWRSELDALVARERSDRGERGEYETESDWKRRVTAELVDVRDFLHEQLSIDIYHHCWPGGDYSDATERIALDVGYRTTTIKGEKNRFGKELAHRIDRISMPLRWDGVLRGLNPLYFRAKTEAYREAPPYHLVRRVLRNLRGVRRGGARP